MPTIALSIEFINKDERSPLFVAVFVKKSDRHHCFCFQICFDCYFNTPKAGWPCPRVTENEIHFYITIGTPREANGL